MHQAFRCVTKLHAKIGEFVERDFWPKPSIAEAGLEENED
jgi:hypothetical protein